MAPDVLTMLYGNLGNQLFQFGATLLVGERTGARSTDYVLAGGAWSGQPNLSHVLGIPVRPPTRVDRMRWTQLNSGPSPLAGMFRRTSAVYEGVTRRVLLSQRSPFEPLPDLEGGRPYKLEGFFQHPSWFGETWRSVTTLLLERSPRGFPDVVARRRAAVQVRRTDYTRYAWDIGPSFYRDALTGMGLDGAELVVMSDDPRFLPWFAEVVRPIGCRLVEPVPLTGNKVLDDFWNMAAGAILIPANSTFSWWAAAVATDRDAGVEVAYPRPWLPITAERPDVPDMGLPGWTAFGSGLAAGPSAPAER